MRLTIDAWLERRNPRIRLLDADTGQEIQRLDSDQVHALVDSGELCPDDLADAADCIERIVLLLALIEDRRGIRRHSDMVFCPVDCVSHDACRRVKRHCQQQAKQFIPLCSSGLSAFATGLQHYTATGTETGQIGQVFENRGG